MAKKVVAYVADWSFSGELNPAQARILTHVNYAFGLIQNGVVELGHLGHLAAIKQMRSRFSSLKVNLSVGGWGADGFSQAVADGAGRVKLARSAVEAVRTLGLTGIDWDWEYPGSGDAGIACHPDDATRMTEMLVRTRELLDIVGREDGVRYEQSIAVGANRTDDYLWNDALPALDGVSLMTYDMGMGNRVGHVTNLRPAKCAAYSVAQSVEAFRAVGVPQDKLLIGAAFYCHAYLGVSFEQPLGGFYRSKGEGFPYDGIDESFEYHWDAEACAAWYRRGEAIYSGDDERSLADKAAYISAEGLGGIIIWELNHDCKNRLLPVLATLND